MRLARTALTGLVAGATLVSTAWAGVSLVPVRDAPLTPTPGTELVDGDADTASAVAGREAAGLAAGEMLVGASKLSMYPRPEDYDGTWEHDAKTCITLDEATLERVQAQPAEEGETQVAHLADTGSPWPENPNCIYMGGFGIGPMNPAVEFDTEYGLWVRSVAIGDGTETLVLTIIDAEGYLWDYHSKCERCGAKQLGEDLRGELGPSTSFVIAATHSHSAPDFLGGWGFVPDWYMAQIADTIKESVRVAVADMAPATIEVGEVLARGQNHERRETYFSAEEQQVTWLRATGGRPRKVIATIGAYAAHPTTRGTNNGTATSDWVGLFEKRLEDRFGGIGLHFMTGLGNMSAEGGKEMGVTLADLLPDVGEGTRLTDTDLRVAERTWKQPTTNVPLDALGVPGFFDRRFLPEPSSVSTGKSENGPCISGSATTVELPATAARIGDQFALTAAPGEVFSNLTNTIKDRSHALVTMPLAQANDALGYMPQSFEMSPIGQQGLGFALGGVLIVNYEDSYSVDRCVGDKVLETSLSLLGELL